MTDKLPEPLVPPDVDLRDFPFMPIEIARLFGSEFHAAANDAEWRAGVTLWLKSYHQVPGGSLPQDDVALCRLAELGRDLRTWKKIREQALHGWAVATDGRLYHKVVGEKVLEAWIEKLGQRKSSGAGNAKRWGIEFSPAAIDASIATAAEMLAKLNPQSRLLQKRLVKDAGGIPGGTSNDDTGDPGGSPDHVPSGSQGKGREDKGKEISNGGAHGFELFWEAYPSKVDRRSAEKSFAKAIEHVELSIIVEAARRYAKSRFGEDPKYTKNPRTWLESEGWLEFGGVKPLTPEQDAAARDKADRLLKRGKYAEHLQ